MLWNNFTAVHGNGQAVCSQSGCGEGIQKKK